MTCREGVLIKQTSDYYGKPALGETMSRIFYAVIGSGSGIPSRGSVFRAGSGLSVDSDTLLFETGIDSPVGFLVDDTGSDPVFYIASYDDVETFHIRSFSSNGGLLDELELTPPLVGFSFTSTLNMHAFNPVSRLLVWDWDIFSFDDFSYTNYPMYTDEDFSAGAVQYDDESTRTSPGLVNAIAARNGFLWACRPTAEDSQFQVQMWTPDLSERVLLIAPDFPESIRPQTFTLACDGMSAEFSTVIDE